jgi:hypothetical protein
MEEPPCCRTGERETSSYARYVLPCASWGSTGRRSTRPEVHPAIAAVGDRALRSLCAHGAWRFPFRIPKLPVLFPRFSGSPVPLVSSSPIHRFSVSPCLPLPISFASCQLPDAPLPGFPLSVSRFTFPFLRFSVSRLRPAAPILCGGDRDTMSADSGERVGGFSFQEGNELGWLGGQYRGKLFWTNVVSFARRRRRWAESQCPQIHALGHRSSCLVHTVILVRGMQRASRSGLFG